MLCVVCDVHLFEGYGAQSTLVRDKGHVHPACEKASAVSDDWYNESSTHRNDPPLSDYSPASAA